MRILEYKEMEPFFFNGESGRPETGRKTAFWELGPISRLAPADLSLPDYTGLFDGRLAG